MKISEYLATFAPIEWDILEELYDKKESGVPFDPRKGLFSDNLVNKSLAFYNMQERRYYPSNRGLRLVEAMVEALVGTI